MQIIKKNTADIKGYDRNARTHSDEQVRQIANSISEFGFNNPILLDDTDTIIAGHGRLAAAQQLGMQEVPCIILSHLSDAQRRAYILADNKIALNGGWDEKLLKLEIEELLEFDVPILGFDIDDFLQEKEIKLKKVNLDSPKMAWVLIGIALPRYGEIQEQIEKILEIEDLILETTVTK